MAPEIRPGRAFKDPLFGIQSTDRLSMSSAGELGVTRSELELRRSLLRQFDGERDFDKVARTRTFDQQQQTAFSLLTSEKMAEALDFGREPEAVREAYGMTLFGQSCLAARRLVEAGSKFVTVIWDAYGA
ncbi:MAG: DUF1501 domain-containing protein [Planctomycetaceae bacterium]